MTLHLLTCKGIHVNLKQRKIHKTNLQGFRMCMGQKTDHGHLNLLLLLRMHVALPPLLYTPSCYGAYLHDKLYLLHHS